MKVLDIENNSIFVERAEEIREKLRPFTELVVFHESFRQAYERLVTRVVTLPPGSLIYLIGPTGSGKTTLLRTLVKRFSRFEVAPTDNEGDAPGGTEHRASEGRYSPPIYVEAPNPQKHVFEWKDLDIRLLKALGEPGIFFKSDLAMELKRLSSGLSLNNNSRKSPPDWLLFQCLEDVLRHHRPWFVGLDEGHAILKLARSAASFEDQLDVLKSLANLSGTRIIISGTYRMKDLIYEGDEATRRSRTVHFGCYRRSGEDFEHFKDALAVLIENSPLPLAFDPLAFAAGFHRGSTGCIGRLKDWVSEANGLAMLEGRENVTREDFRSTELEKKQLIKLVVEINKFKSFYKESSTGAVLDDFSPVTDGGERSGNPIQGTNSAGKGDGESRRRNKPGKTRPTRHPVGAEEAQ